MTVSSTTTFQVFSGGGTTFAVPFTFTANSQVKVYEIDDSVSPATVTLQVEGGGSDYTIVGTNVVFNSATAATSRIYVGRSTPLTQAFDPNTTERFDVTTLETELDKIVKQIQELDEKMDRAFVLDLGSTAISNIPSVEDNAGKFLRVNADEDGVEWATGTESTVFNEDIAPNAAIELSKLATVTASRALVSTAGGIIGPSTVTTTELQQLSGVGSAVKGISDTKTFTNTTIDADGTGNSITNIENADIKSGANIAHSKMAALTASRAMVTDGSGAASASSVTSTELGYLSGATSSIQTQINALGTTTGKLIGYQVFTSSGSYDKTVNNPSFIIAEGVGAGGGGGGIAATSSTESAVSGAGGGGGYSRKLILNAALSASETVTIGAAGTAGTAGANAGGNGGTSSFGAHITMTGGSGGSGGTNGTGSGSSSGGAGGTGSGGDININGQAGSYGRRLTTTGVGGFTHAPKGGNSLFGFGGNNAVVTNGVSAAGVGYGAGASGTTGTNLAATAGSAGTAGLIIVWEFS